MGELILACPGCQERHSFTVVHDGPDARLATCAGCGLGVLVWAEPAGTGWTVTDTRPHQAPITRTEMAGLPGPVAADLLEAGRCYSFLAYRGAGLLARRAVEQVAVLCRVPLTRRTMQQKVAWLLADGRLPATSRDAARTVVEVTGAAAHGGTAITRVEAHAAVRAAFDVASAAVGGERP